MRQREHRVDEEAIAELQGEQNPVGKARILKSAFEEAQERDGVTANEAVGMVAAQFAMKVRDVDFYLSLLRIQGPLRNALESDALPPKNDFTLRTARPQFPLDHDFSQAYRVRMRLDRMAQEAQSGRKNVFLTRKHRSVRQQIRRILGDEEVDGEDYDPFNAGSYAASIDDVAPYEPHAGIVTGRTVDGEPSGELLAPILDATMRNGGYRGDTSSHQQGQRADDWRQRILDSAKKHGVTIV